MLSFFLCYGCLCSWASLCKADNAGVSVGDGGEGRIKNISPCLAFQAETIEDAGPCGDYTMWKNPNYNVAIKIN